MNPALHIISPGLLTTVQDLGRLGAQKLGVPVGGAMDPLALRAANLLVGNATGAGALEITYLGPTFRVEAEQVRVAFVGSSARIEIVAPDGSDVMRMELMQSVCLRRGQVVRVGSLAGGSLLYMAVEGGFDIEPVLGSVSTYMRGRMGGWQGRALQAGDVLPLCLGDVEDREEQRMEGLDLAIPERLRVIIGPQNDYFSPETLEAFCAADYRIGGGADRMGMRLEGPVLHHSRGFNITSDAIAAGSIQVPGNGLPIVLRADRQTTGGYPKIATVISADLAALGRMPIGATLRFEAVSLETALEARAKMEQTIAALPQKIVSVPNKSRDFSVLLYDSNLISGVCHALGGVDMMAAQ
eukprot:gene14822-14956_t